MPEREARRVDAIGERGTYRALRTLALPDVFGRPAAELGLVPPIFAERALLALRRSAPMPPAERPAALRRAGEIFAHEPVFGVTPDEYCSAVSTVAGVPLEEVRRTTHAIEDAARSTADVLGAAIPAGAVTDRRAPGSRHGAVWRRRGEVLSVVASGNHPGVHTLWLEALAMGYRVAVRPSNREPFTPNRLVGALHAAGFGHDQVAFLPTDHAGAALLVKKADLSVVYGGGDVQRRHAGDPSVRVFGPGRSKILVTAESGWQDHLDVIAASVSRHAGLTCMNTTAVFVEGDPAPLAEALAAELSRLPVLPPDDPGARLPAVPAAAAERLDEFVGRLSGTATNVSGRARVFTLLGECAVLGPSVFRLGSATAPQARAELPFPCVWVAPWSPRDGVRPLRDTLALTAMTSREDVVDSLLDEPSISNVYVGGIPTTFFSPGMPHDSYLADFLMRTKGFVRSS